MSGPNGRSRNPMEDMLARKLLASSPMARITASAPKLPDLKLPKLDGLTIAMPQPPPVTEQELLARADALWVERAPRRPRAIGEALAVGDEVVADVVAYAQGKIVPFTIHEKFRFLLVPGAVAPGFCEGLVGAKLGECVRLTAAVPEDHPVASLRGVPAVFVVQLHAADEVRPPEGEPEALAKALGIPSLDDLSDLLAADVAAEREQLLRDELTRRVLAEVLRRAPVEVSPTQIDIAIGQKWQEHEGRFLLQAGAAPEDRELALKAWLDSPTLREEMRQRLANTQLLRAVALEHQLALSPEELEAFLAQSASETSVSPEELRAELAQQPDALNELANGLLYLKAVDHLLSHTEVRAVA